jgi:hypothetical protein
MDRENYYTNIHLAAARYALNAIAALGRQEITILDLPGGNGDLAERIIKEAQARDSKLRINYKLLDGNETEVHLANKRFRTLNSEHIKASAFQRDIRAYGFDAEKMKGDTEIGLPQEGVGILMSCGGMPNKLIAKDTKEAANCVSFYTDLLDREGAFAIYCGASSLLVNFADHKKLEHKGIEVRNLSDPSNLQIHVVRRWRAPLLPGTSQPSLPK